MPRTLKVRAAQGVRAAEDDPDALYRERADLAKAHQAADIWSGRLAANHRDFESAWKLARAEYWLGTQSPPAERRGALERGTEAGRTASMIDMATLPARAAYPVSTAEPARAVAARTGPR